MRTPVEHKIILIHHTEQQPHNLVAVLLELAHNSERKARGVQQVVVERQ